MTDQSANEPTMEEILASIRRIISEDEPAPEAPKAAAPAAPAAEPEPVHAPVEADDPFAHAELAVEEDVLDLSDFAAEPAPAPAKAEPDDLAAGHVETDDFDAGMDFDMPAPAPAIAIKAEPSLLSERAASSAATAFGALAQTLYMPKEGRTLEDVVAELLRPLLQDWLEKNLPAIVEAQVQAEVERISRRSGVGR